MGIPGLVRRTVDRVRRGDDEALSEVLYEIYAGAWRRTGWHVPRGTNIYDLEWDALLLLDACRVDLLEEVRPEHDFLGPVGSIRSVGSMSEEWMRKTFTPEYEDEMADTAYVTANVFTNEVLDPADFAVLDEVWRYGWEDEAGTVPPRPVTERAIHVAREADHDRLIVHYMQPHHPFIMTDFGEEIGADPFGREGHTTEVDALRKGLISLAEFWTAYRANLEHVLGEVELLLSNLDAERVVVSSDHGDAVGEWGIYDHPAGFLHPSVTDVPWSVTTAEDRGTFEPTLEPSDEADSDVEERLKRLGYL
jgi:hypothetical protein